MAAGPIDIVRQLNGMGRSDSGFGSDFSAGSASGPASFPALITSSFEARFPEARVLIIMTGGTICMRPTPASGLQPIRGFLDAAMRPRPSFNDGSVDEVKLKARLAGEDMVIKSLRTPPTAYGRQIRYGILEFSPLLDSSYIASDGWAAIAEAVKENYLLYDGFVVLHGTDSLANSASALSFMLEDLGKPVILTGSQASIFELQSDADGNLLGALVLAGTFVIPEVTVFFHQRLLRGNRTIKVAATAFDAFASPSCDVLATVSGVGVRVNWALVRRPTAIARFRVATPCPDTACVACLRVFPGIRIEMVDAVLNLPGLRGLVLETFGLGNAPGQDGRLTAAVQDAVRRGIVIVNVSQCVSGYAAPLYGPGTDLGRAGIVFGCDLTPEAALAKLAYVLAMPGLSADEVVALMARSLRGEMTEPVVPVFSHPADPDLGPGLSLMPADAAFAVLAYAVRASQTAAVCDLLDADRQLLDRADYAGNSAIHLAALNKSADVLRELLTRGASVHARNHANMTPLDLAESAASAECVRMLQQAGGHHWEDGVCKNPSLHTDESLSESLGTHASRDLAVPVPYRLYR